LEDELQKLPVGGYRLQFSRVEKSGIQAAHFEVFLDTPQGEHLADSEYEETQAGSGENMPGADRHALGTTKHAHDHDHSHPHPHPHNHEHSDAHEHGHDYDHPHDHDHSNNLEHSDAHEHHTRTFPEIRQIILSSALSERVKDTAIRIFERLATAEGHVHNRPFDQVHFHEVGGVDAIVDIVSASIGLEQLKIGKVWSSPLHLGSGFIRSAHGLLPVPAPATAHLLVGAPVYSSEVKGELVTPTGAAILTAIVSGYGPMPLMKVEAIGYGAGTRERDFPNVLRAVLGTETNQMEKPEAVYLDEPETIVSPEQSRQVRDPFPEQHQKPAGPSGYHSAQAVVIEANIDDMNPQLYEYLSERLLAVGALDTFLIPVQMKKGRPGLLLQILAHPSSVDNLIAIVFAESTSIGLRTYEVTKHMLQRDAQIVQTPYGPVRVKLAWQGSRLVNIAPEYEDCRTIARQSDVPLKDVLAAARLAAEKIRTG